MFSSNTSQASSAATYIEDVFSTYLYTGTGSTQTITNGIDLSTKGGMTWFKGRDVAAHGMVFDSNRGVTKYLLTSLTNAEGTSGAGERLTAYNSNGFSLGTDPGSAINASPYNYVSWTFREQAKFFDVVTYTGTGANRTVAHNLGSVPGCIIVKRTDTTGAWAVYHRSLANTEYLVLNTTAAKATGATYWNSTTPTSTEFSLGTATDVNANGGTYVAYLFAHDAGGFGLTGTDNVISCGSFTTDGSGIASVTLGYEPQYLLVKRTDSTGDWYIWDSMRGLTMDVEASLFANSSAVEEALVNFVNPTATGFVTVSGFANSSPYIYIAIRRGPMKTPTTGTSVFSPLTSSGATGTTLTTNFPVDMLFTKYRSGTGSNAIVDRLRGVSTDSTGKGSVIYTNSTLAESGTAGESLNWNNTGFQVPSNWGGNSNVFYPFRRAPGFFDEVCYTGTGANTTQTHNLGVAPEMMIVKRRDAIGAWQVYSAALSNTEYLVLNTTAAKATGTTRWNSTTPTASVFSLGTDATVNASGGTYVAYLFATLASVSKVGSYTGTGTTKQIDCGFTGGARFVLIKRTDSTGDWYVWDSARGIVAGNDPYLLLNSTAAEVTSTDYVDTYSAGFEISSTAPAAINANGGTFIFLAIA